MRVTFDTNTLDRSARPERFAKDARQPEYRKVHQAILARAIEGFFCETLVTLEGVQNKDRVAVLGSTTLQQRRTGGHDVAGQHTINIALTVEQPQRQPLHPETLARVQAALGIGMRVLGAPRIGGTRIEDPDHKIYVVEPDEAQLAKRLDIFMEAARDIEARGLGAAQGLALAERFAQRAQVTEPWYRSLGRASNIHEERAVQRAVAEWADGDSVAAHIGYEIEFFCTEDQGHSTGGPSVLDSTSRAWLQANYGVHFVTLTELAEMV